MLHIVQSRTMSREQVRRLPAQFAIDKQPEVSVLSLLLSRSSQFRC
jgi:hypothetical protein